MEKELQKITELIKEFNKSDSKFQLELRIFNKEIKNYIELSKIMGIVCRATGLTPEYIKMKTKDQEILVPRQMCMYLAHLYSKKSLAEIGRYFGKDHATVLHSSKKIKDYLYIDKSFREKWLPLINYCHSLHTNNNSEQTPPPFPSLL